MLDVDIMTFQDLTTENSMFNRTKNQIEQKYNIIYINVIKISKNIVMFTMITIKFSFKYYRAAVLTKFNLIVTEFVLQSFKSIEHF